MPIGILGSLVICTILYILVSLMLTGLVQYDRLNVAAPGGVRGRAGRRSCSWLRPFITIGAVLGLGSVVLVMLLGQSRVFYSMSRDGLHRARGPARSIPSSGRPTSRRSTSASSSRIITGTFPIQILGELVNIGTLLAFVLVCAGVWILRKTRPDLERPFRTPLVPLVPILGILACFGLMATLPGDTWIRLFVWLVIGFVIYFGYGRKHSVLQREREPPHGVPASPAKEHLRAAGRGRRRTTASSGRSGPLNLVALGIGAIIGAGIFVLTGTAAAQLRRARPSSLVRPGRHRLRVFAGLCYAEFASMIPIAGSRPTPTATPRWASSSPGSSAGT